MKLSESFCLGWHRCSSRAPTLRRTVPPGGGWRSPSIPFPKKNTAVLPLSRRELLTRRGDLEAASSCGNRASCAGVLPAFFPAKNLCDPSFALSLSLSLLLKRSRIFYTSFYVSISLYSPRFIIIIHVVFYRHKF